MNDWYCEIQSSDCDDNLTCGRVKRLNLSVLKPYHHDPHVTDSARISSMALTTSIDSVFAPQVASHSSQSVDEASL